ncbi:hypothetical protein [Salinisphaera sp. Q1T1-3]|uniref:hypothetical protein n=1 Tax=Salinisphaera sp. Q1T1-3 TaxID=2321229 RepID=UPI000E72898F|nr:hypothetical protein [Salinisphaera sp. Q1T1-3]RJS94003.1 hypothetical protein D3260_05350 [Salinisphaera sp. Q1T1-3]
MHSPPGTERAADPRRGLAYTVGLCCAGLAALGFWLFCNHMRQGAITADWPWLYRAGQSLWQHGLPHHDTMSWTFPARPWVVYQWLFEAVAAPVYGLLGATLSVYALCLVGLGMYAVGPAWYLARRGVPYWLTLAIGGATLIPVSVNLGLRPMLASNLALLAQWVVIERLRAGRLGAWPAAGALALIYAIWANSHLGFTLGLTSLALFFAADLIEHGRTSRPATCTSRRRLCTRYLGLASAAVLATGCNPYGWSLYRYIVDLSLKTEMNAHIHELMPPRLDNGYMIVGLLLIALYLVCLIIQRRRIAWAGVLHVALFTIMTIDALRFVIWAGLFYALAAPPVIAAALARMSGGRIAATGPTTRPWRYVWLPGLVGALLITSPGSGATAGPVQMAGCRAMTDGIRYLDHHLPPDAHWFSSEKVGSCTHLVAPKRRVFIDTRFDMYPETFVLAWFRAYQYRDGWQALFERWDIEAALLADNAPLTPVLTDDVHYRRRAVGNHMLLFERQH